MEINVNANDGTHERDAAIGSVTKKSYETPTVTAHGSVAEITKGAGAFIADGPFGSVPV